MPVAGFLRMSGRAMRRVSGVPLGPHGALTFLAVDPTTVRLADVVEAPVLPPPPVPPFDPGQHADVHAETSASGAWQRLVVLPSGLPDPVLDFEGASVTVVRL